MTVVRDIPLDMETWQGMRLHELGGVAALRPRTRDLLEELLATAQHLVRPSFACEVHRTSGLGHHRLYLENGAVLDGSLLPSTIGSAREVAIVVCTIGPALEEKVAEYFARGDPSRAVVLDGIGNVAVDLLSQEACRFVSRELVPAGYTASSPISPGMRGWPVSQQRQLLRLAPAGQIGVLLTSLAVMAPRKSQSMALGIGREMPTWTQADVCARCESARVCAAGMRRGQ